MSHCYLYTIYGDNFEKYYHPVKINLDMGYENIFIVTTYKFEMCVKAYFKDYLPEKNIFVYDDKYLPYVRLLRFLVIENLKYDYYFFKDSDSIITSQEKDVMCEWMNNPKSSSLIIRNHYLHVVPILAGMFGIRSDIKVLILLELNNYINNKSNVKYYDYDQRWLRENIYPKIIGDSQVYTSHFYFIGEKVKILKFDELSKDFIGSSYFSDSNINFITFYKHFLIKKLYCNKMLFLPYRKKLFFVYNSTMLTALFSYFFRFLYK